MDCIRSCQMQPGGSGAVRYRRAPCCRSSHPPPRRPAAKSVIASTIISGRSGRPVFGSAAGPPAGTPEAAGDASIVVVNLAPFGSRSVKMTRVTSVDRFTARCAGCRASR